MKTTFGIIIVFCLILGTVYTVRHGRSGQRNVPAPAAAPAPPERDPEALRIAMLARDLGDPPMRVAALHRTSSLICNTWERSAKGDAIRGVLEERLPLLIHIQETSEPDLYCIGGILRSIETVEARAAVAAFAAQVNA